MRWACYGEEDPTKSAPSGITEEDENATFDEMDPRSMKNAREQPE